jgi:hypothetical protein
MPYERVVLCVRSHDKWSRKRVSILCKASTWSAGNFSGRLRIKVIDKARYVPLVQYPGAFETRNTEAEQNIP